MLPNLTQIRDLLQNKDHTFNVAMEFLRHRIDRMEDEDLVKKMLTTWGEFIVRRNVDEIFDHAESPIEKLFLNSVLYFGLLHDTRIFIFTPRGISIKGQLDQYTAIRKGMEKVRVAYQEQNPGTNAMTAEIEILRLIEGRGDEDFYQLNMIHSFLYDTFDLKNSYHFTLQTYIENVKLNGKQMRPDITIWLPEDPEFKLVIECDGFQYHSNRESFVADRQRDRLLQKNGYKVHRYSGLEIYHKPVETGYDLCQYLFQEWGKKVSKA